MKLIVTSLPTYDAYKDSKVDWLGKIPKDWLLLRAKYIWNEIVDLSKDGSEILLSVSQFTGITKNNTETQRAESLKGYKIVKKNDLVSNIMLAWNGCLGISPYDGITSPAYAIYQLKNNSEFFPKYFHYLFRTDLYKAEFRRNSSGVIESRLRLYTEKFFSIPVCVPSLNEQTAIVNFLDKKTDQIDKVIAIKEQQIARLKEYQQITIQKAVTQGLNPNVAMKDSGIDWIGKIPKHWEVKKLKFLAKINNGQDYKHIEAENGYPVIGSGGQFAFAKHYLYDGEAILLGRKGTIDKPLYINTKFWTVDTMFFCVCNKHIYTKYIYYCAITIPFSFYVTSTALPSMTQSALLNHKFAIPSFDEQKEIVNYIETESNKIEKAIELQQLQIEKLKEYKTTLINSAVTGKIKVV